MIERTILSNLLLNEKYCRKVIPHLKDEYFSEKKYKALFHVIQNYIAKYNHAPTIEAFKIDISSKEGIPESLYHDMIEEIEYLKVDDNTDIQWLFDVSEEFCQEKAIYNAIMESISIIDDKKGNLLKGAIPKMLSDALGVSFDTSVGHDYIEDANKRFDFYHQKEEKIPFDLDYFNKITRGGLSKKSLNVILAGTGVGKSLFMCHAASACFMQGKNVLYITMEMAEEKIGERIDANLLDIPVTELETMPKSLYDKKMSKLKEKSIGKLIIEEYPTASAGAAHFRALLNELKSKKNFVPDIIFIDYLNICMSSRIKPGSNTNSYTYVKAIAEELRGLAVEYNVPIVTATQTTRGGYNASDIDLTDTSESFGLPATADFMFALISTEELQEMNQIIVKQLKNRYADPTRYRRFVIGVDREKMRLYDVEQSAQNITDGPVFDESEFAEKFDKQKFNDVLV